MRAILVADFLLALGADVGALPGMYRAYLMGGRALNVYEWTAPSIHFAKLLDTAERGKFWAHVCQTHIPQLLASGSAGDGPCFDDGYDRNEDCLWLMLPEIEDFIGASGLRLRAVQPRILPVAPTPAQPAAPARSSTHLSPAIPPKAQRTTVLDGVIGRAKREAKSDKPGPVWAQLVAMAEHDPPIWPLDSHYPGKGIRYCGPRFDKSNGAEFDILTRHALDGRLRRHRERDGS